MLIINHSFTHQATVETRKGNREGDEGTDPRRYVEVEFIVVGLPEQNQVRPVRSLLDYEVLYGGTLDPPSEVKHIPSDFIHPHRLPITQQPNFVLVLRELIQTMKRNLVLELFYLREMLVVNTFWLFYIDLELTGLTYLE